MSRHARPCIGEPISSQCSELFLRFPGISTQWWRHLPHLDNSPLLSTWTKTFKCFLLINYTFNHGQIEDCSQELCHLITLQLLNKIPFNVFWKLWCSFIHLLNVAFAKTKLTDVADLSDVRDWLSSWDSHNAELIGPTSWPLCCLTNTENDRPEQPCQSHFTSWNHTVNRQILETWGKRHSSEIQVSDRFPNTVCHNDPGMP